MSKNPIIIRAFRAVDEPETCQRFYDGHINVLRSFGIEPISSAKKEWFENPAVYGIIAERDGVAVGGLKIHKVGGSQPLPLEESIGYLDDKIYDVINKHDLKGAGEGCGLWNAREVAGFGISLELSRAMVAFSVHIGVVKLFLLTSDHTVSMTRKLGFRVIHALGNNGDFNYPTPKYIARVVIGHTQNFSWSTPYNKSVMRSLRSNPVQKRNGMGTKRDLVIDYNLKLS